MMKLFMSPGACSMAPHIVLEEVGATYETYKVDLRSKKLPNGEDFLKVNPKGQVPTLQTEDGKILTENAVILQYISDTYHYKNILPAAGSWERYKANEWLNYIATEVHKSMGAFFSIDRLYPEKEVADKVRAATKMVMEKKLEYLAAHLAENEYLMGREFTAPDAYLFTVLSWHKFADIDMDLWPSLRNYMERMAARPSSKKAIRAEET